MTPPHCRVHVHPTSLQKQTASWEPGSSTQVRQSWVRPSPRAEVSSFQNLLCNDLPAPRFVPASHNTHPGVSPQQSLKSTAFSLPLLSPLSPFGLQPVMLRDYSRNHSTTSGSAQGTLWDSRMEPGQWNPSWWAHSLSCLIFLLFLCWVHIRHVSWNYPGNNLPLSENSTLTNQKHHSYWAW